MTSCPRSSHTSPESHPVTALGGDPALRHFAAIGQARRADLFLIQPSTIYPDSPRDLLAHALGATLYTRGTQPALAETIIRQGRRGTASMVVCLEDAIGAQEVAQGHANLANALGRLSDSPREGLPLIFCRVRQPAEIAQVCRSNPANLLAGFVIPKFRPETGAEWLTAVRLAGAERGRRLWAMPILETWELVDPAVRPAWLHEVRNVLEDFRDLVLTVRIGAADIGGTIGIRRNRELTAYAIAPLRDAISAVIGVLARDRSVVPAIAACVWEHYESSSRWFKPQLGSLIHDDLGAKAAPESLVRAGLGVLVEELALDRAHGLVGKTAIHPSQVPLINAWHAVTHEDYLDARAVLATQGASASGFANRMNESQPHRAWAEQTLLRSKAFGVLCPSVSWFDVMTDPHHFELTMPQAVATSSGRAIIGGAP